VTHSKPNSGVDGFVVFCTYLIEITVLLAEREELKSNILQFVDGRFRVFNIVAPKNF